jgi:[acyl-carrier-protein] S-malonyltransferase
MGGNLLEYKCAKRVFGAGKRVFGKGLVDLVSGEKTGDISGVVDVQGAVDMIDCAYYEVLKEKGFDCDVVVGHSLGTYPALYVAGVLNLISCFELVKERAELMEECVSNVFKDRKGGEVYMGAVIGCSLEDVMWYVRGHKNSGPIYIANINSYSQIVLSGNPRSIDRANKYFGRKFILLDGVPGPFHSPYMEGASNEMEGVLRDVVFGEFEKIYISDHTGEVVSDPRELKRVLVDQISGRVDWVKAIDTAIGLECDKFVQCGLGPLVGFMGGRGVEVLDGKELLRG